MVAQFMRLAVDDAAETAELQETLEREGARVRWHEDTLQVLWPKPDVTRIRSWLERSNGRVSVLDTRPVEVADELLVLRRAE
jgi:hypothetical protein